MPETLVNKRKNGAVRNLGHIPVFGLSDKTWTCGLYHPNGDLNIFLVILSFFRHFRYGKNDLSRSRGILSPGAPIVSMVVYVVVKNPLPNRWLRPHGSGWFFIVISGQPMWSLSQPQLIKVVVLYLFFSHLSRGSTIKICTAIDKEKPGAVMYIMSVPMYLHMHDGNDWNYTPISLPTPSIANIWYAVSKEKGN